jgi:hypothetical protein
VRTSSRADFHRRFELAVLLRDDNCSVRAAGYRVVCLSEDNLIYRQRPGRTKSIALREREEFNSRWARELREPDPFFSPSLNGDETISLRLPRG